MIAVAEGLDNHTARVPVKELWQQSWENVAQLGIEDARAHPYVKAWRENFAALGVSMKRFPTSIEAMLRRALKGGDVFSINPLVDFYNALSLQHICPAGAFDLDALDQSLALRMTTGDERFTALDATEPVTVPAGEVAYTSGADVLTRHFMWRQAKTGLVQQQSSKIFLVSEVPGIGGKEKAIRVEFDLKEGLQNLFGVCSQTFLLDSSQIVVEF